MCIGRNKIWLTPDLAFGHPNLLIHCLPLWHKECLCSACVAQLQVNPYQFCNLHSNPIASILFLIIAEDCI